MVRKLENGHREWMGSCSLKSRNKFYTTGGGMITGICCLKGFHHEV